MKRLRILVLILCFLVPVWGDSVTGDIHIPEARYGNALVGFLDAPVGNLKIKEDSAWFEVERIEGLPEGMKKVAGFQGGVPAQPGKSYIADLSFALDTPLSSGELIMANDEVVPVFDNREGALRGIAFKGGASMYFTDKVNGHILYHTYCQFPEAVLPSDMPLGPVAFQVPMVTEGMVNPGNSFYSDGKFVYLKREKSGWFVSEDIGVTWRKMNPGETFNKKNVYKYVGILRRTDNLPFGGQGVTLNGSVLTILYPSTGTPIPLMENAAWYDVDGSLGVQAVVYPEARAFTEVAFTVGSSRYTVNGVTATMDAAPFIKENRIMVPMRFVGEALGMDITYEKETHRAILEDGGKYTILVDLKTMDLIINGQKVVPEVAPVLTGGRTYLPIAVLGEALEFTRETPGSGRDISWDKDTTTAIFRVKGQ